MNNEENYFEEFLKSKLENHTVDVSDSVWEHIEKKQKKREKFIWFKQYLNTFLAVDILLMVTFATISLFNNSAVKSENKEAITVLRKSNTQSTPSAAFDTDVNNHSLPKKATATIENHTKKVQEKNAFIDKAEKATSILGNKSVNAPPVQKNEPAIFNKSKINNPNHNAEPHRATTISTELTENFTIPETVHLAMMQHIAVKPINLSKFNSFDVFPSTAEIDFLPASVAFSKPKSLIKKEQKALIAHGATNQTTLNQTSKENGIPEQNESSRQDNENSVVKTAMAEAKTQLDTIYGHKKFKGYVAIDALLSPEITGRSLFSEQQAIKNYILRRDSAERARLAYSSTLRLNFFINKNLFFNTGINYAQRREKFSILHKWQTHEEYIDSSKYVTYVDPFAGNMIYKTYDTLDYVTTHKDTLHHNLVMRFVDIPAMAGYKWLGKRSGIAIQGGLMFNLLFKQKGTIANFNYTANDVQLSYQNQFKTHTGISICGGIVTNHRLRDNIELLLEPHATYTLKPINIESYPLQQKLFSYGLRVGMRIKL